MSQAIRAVYTEGQLRLLDPVDLAEGEEIHLMILSAHESVTAALGDLLVKASPLVMNYVDEATLAREIEDGFHGQSPLSDTIIDERREGP